MTSGFLSGTGEGTRGREAWAWGAWLLNHFSMAVARHRADPKGRRGEPLEMEEAWG